MARPSRLSVVIRFAASTRASGHIRPKTAAVIRGSAATSGTPIAVPRAMPK
ncbi:hypothetical protein GTY53_10955 [Streptomyces sp. SID7805]|nr:hypothetical protein [Streptomyces sp. SID7805]